MTPQPVAEQFIPLLENSDVDGLIELYKRLTDADRKKLASEVKRQMKAYFEFGEIRKFGVSMGSWGYIKGSDAQRNLVTIAAFVCYNKSDFQRDRNVIRCMRPDFLDPILPWYCPSWFSDYLNSTEALGHNDYFWYLELMQKGYLQPGKDLVARQLAMALSGWQGNVHEVRPEKLLQSPVILEEHIWYLFEVESSINHNDRWPAVPASQHGHWVSVFLRFSAEGRIDRRRLLQESLLASNRNFNKSLSGWFADLFAALEPTVAEGLELQTELFTVLGSSNGKPVNVALQMLKKIVGEPAFAAAGFLDMAPVVLASGAKATLTSGLMILEKLAQKAAEHRGTIVRLACQCFISKEDEVQMRAGKLVQKFGVVGDEGLRQELAAYEGTLLSGARRLVAAWLGPEGGVGLVGDAGLGAGLGSTDAVLGTGLGSADGVLAVGSANGSTGAGSGSAVGDFLAARSGLSGDGASVVPGLAVGTPTGVEPGMAGIPMPATMDDLIFLASQAFDNNESWHIDVLAAALVQFAPRLKPEDVALLEPAFQRALAMTKNGSRSNNGQLDHLLAIFFIDFGNWLARKFPSASDRIKEVYKVHDHKNEFGKTISFLVIPDSGSYTFKWKREIEFYEPYKLLLLTALDRIRGGSDLPLISTPTLTPCWIPAETLVRRLHHYQELGREPENMDLQVAISRCYWQDSTALLLVRELLTGELRALMEFVLDEGAAPKGASRYKAAWMVASLTRRDKKEWPAFAEFSYSSKPFNNYVGRLRWESVLERYVLKYDDWRKGRKKGDEDERKVLLVHKEKSSQRMASFAGKILAKLMPAKKEDAPMLYESLHFKLRRWEAIDNDIRRILSLAPHNPEPVLTDVLREFLRWLNPGTEMERRAIVASEQFLYEVWDQPGEMSMLFLGSCLLLGDKTIAQMAAEIWLKAVSMGKMDSAALGRIVGLHERIEIAPLKRFTDLVSQSLFKVSPLHDREMAVLIGAMLEQLPDEPVKGLKKLLELYGEVGSSRVDSGVGPAGLPEAITARLRVWEANAGLKKVVSGLLARS